MQPGQHARVVGFCEGGPVSRRLAELGLLPGRVVHYLRNAPLRDPIEIKIGASFLSLRRSEAARVMVVVDEVSL